MMHACTRLALKRGSRCFHRKGTADSTGGPEAKAPEVLLRADDSAASPARGSSKAMPVRATRAAVPAGVGALLAFISAVIEGGHISDNLTGTLCNQTD